MKLSQMPIGTPAAVHSVVSLIERSMHALRARLAVVYESFGTRLIQSFAWRHGTAYFPNATLPARLNVLTGRMQARYDLFGWVDIPSSSRQFFRE